MSRTPKEIGRQIADAGALIGPEGEAVAGAAARAIRRERNGAVYFTKAEARVVLAVVSAVVRTAEDVPAALRRAEGKLSGLRKPTK